MSILNLLGVVVLAARGASAPPFEAPAFVPESYQVEPGALLAARVEGESGEASHFFVRVEGTQQNADAPERDESGRVLLKLETPGRTMVGIDWKPRVEPVELGELLRYFRARGDKATYSEAGFKLKASVPVRVRRLESAKLIVTAGADCPGGATSTSKAGQTVEIRPLMDPASIAVGSDLAFKVYAPGRGRVLVLARHADDPAVPLLTTLDRTATLRIDAAGTWRLEMVMLNVLEGDPEADAEVASATLAFEVKEATP